MKGIDKLYLDQAMQGFKHPGIQFMSFYTPEGIRRMDTLFCNRIRACKRGEPFTEYAMCYWSVFSKKPKHEPRREVERVWKDTKKSLTKDIKDNPHLHPKIKENLLFNLNS